MPLPHDLLDLHQKLGARLVGERITGYASPAEEDQALQTGCAVLDRSARGKLRLTGTERTGFLHGQVTADVNGLAAGRAAYTAMLTPKGQMVCDGRVWCRADHHLFDVEPGREGPVRELFDRHIISEDVEVADVTAEYALFSVVGPRSAEMLGVASLEEHAIEELELTGLGHATAIGTRVGKLGGIDLLVRSADARAALESLLARGAKPIGEDAFDVVRVEAGLPRFGVDMDEETLPLEANLGDRAISFTKGCYVGQEIVARASYRGGVRHKLFGFRLSEGPLPADDTPLFKTIGDAKPAAELTHAVVSPRFGVIALGYARREHQTPGLELLCADGRKAVVCALPFG